MQNSESHLRTIAAWALGEVGDVKAIEPLSQLIEDKDDSVSEAVKEALSKLRNINDR